MCWLKRCVAQCEWDCMGQQAVQVREQAKRAVNLLLCSVSLLLCSAACPCAPALSSASCAAPKPGGAAALRQGADTSCPGPPAFFWAPNLTSTSYATPCCPRFRWSGGTALRSSCRRPSSAARCLPRAARRSRLSGWPGWSAFGSCGSAWPAAPSRLLLHRLLRLHTTHLSSVQGGAEHACGRQAANGPPLVAFDALHRLLRLALPHHNPPDCVQPRWTDVCKPPRTDIDPALPAPAAYLPGAARHSFCVPCIAGPLLGNATTLCVRVCLCAFFALAPTMCDGHP